MANKSAKNLVEKEMENQAPEEPVQEPQAPEVVLGFLEDLWQSGWKMADVASKMVEFPRPDNKAVRSFGFKDANNRKEIVLTATREQWKAWFEDALKKE